MKHLGRVAPHRSERRFWCQHIPIPILALRGFEKKEPKTSMSITRPSCTTKAIGGWLYIMSSFGHTFDRGAYVARLHKESPLYPIVPLFFRHCPSPNAPPKIFARFPSAILEATTCITGPSRSPYAFWEEHIRRFQPTRTESVKEFDV